MVGASLIGGIHLECVERQRWVHAGVTQLNRRLQKGEEIGHFAFGSTVVVILPRDVSLLAPRGLGEIRMGQAL
jgi:phosphatidylserine decarboxylase